MHQEHAGIAGTGELARSQQAAQSDCCGRPAAPSPPSAAFTEPRRALGFLLVPESCPLRHLSAFWSSWSSCFALSFAPGHCGPLGAPGLAASARAMPMTQTLAPCLSRSTAGRRCAGCRVYQDGVWGGEEERTLLGSGGETRPGVLTPPPRGGLSTSRQASS